jgi:hypothetical protein
MKIVLSFLQVSTNLAFIVDIPWVSQTINPGPIPSCSSF